jgi:hypothetical protein
MTYPVWIIRLQNFVDVFLHFAICAVRLPLQTRRHTNRRGQGNEHGKNQSGRASIAYVNRQLGVLLLEALLDDDARINPAELEKRNWAVFVIHRLRDVEQRLRFFCGNHQKGPGGPGRRSSSLRPILEGPECHHGAEPTHRTENRERKAGR